MAPSTITFLITGIPDHARLVCVVLDGDNYYSDTCRELDGQRSLRIEYRGVPAGDYEAGAKLDGKLIGSQVVTIVGGGYGS